MQPDLRKLLRLFVTFVAIYALFLPFWLTVKERYDHSMTLAAYHLLGAKYDFDVKPPFQDAKNGKLRLKVIPEHDFMGRNGKLQRLVMNMPMERNIAQITTNVPMSVALFLALVLTYARSPKRKAVLFAEGIAFLLLLHIISVGSSVMELYFQSVRHAAAVLQPYLDRFHIPSDKNLGYINYFFITYMSRFEPFLLAIVIWLGLQREKNAGKKTAE